MKTNIYHEGLKAIAERDGVSLNEALKIVLADLKETNGAEHIAPTRKAFRNLIEKDKKV